MRIAKQTIGIEPMTIPLISSVPTSVPTSPLKQNLFTQEVVKRRKGFFQFWYSQTQFVRICKIYYFENLWLYKCRAEFKTITIVSGLCPRSQVEYCLEFV